MDLKVKDSVDYKERRRREIIKSLQSFFDERLLGE